MKKKFIKIRKSPNQARDENFWKWVNSRPRPVQPESQEKKV
jgi:hypothetical protein